MKKIFDMIIPEDMCILIPMATLGGPGLVGGGSAQRKPPPAAATPAEILGDFGQPFMYRGTGSRQSF